MPWPGGGRALRAWSGDKRGVTATVVALSFFALVMAGALSIDLGSIFLNARQLQGVADLAAMAAAQGLTSSTTEAQDIQNAQTAAVNTVALNPWPFTNPGTASGTPVVATTVTPGVYNPTPTEAASQRFTANTTAPNAARVTLTAPVRLLFIGGFLGNPTFHITRTATAASTQLAAFSIGSGLASVDGGLANSLLQALTGSSVQLSVMNYNSLVGAQVDLFTYLNALSTRLNLTGGSYNSLLAGTVSMPTALAALGDALGAQGQTAAATAANQLVGISASAPGVQLSALFNLGPYGNQDHGSFSTGGAAVSLNAMSMVSALLTAANGQRQLQLNLGVSVPGVLSVQAYLAIGQRPSNSSWLTITQSNSVIVSTAQMRLYLVASVLPSGSLLGNLGLAQINLPVFVELASAEAKLASMQCSSDPTQQSMTLSVMPSLGTLAIAQVSNPGSTLQNFASPVSLTPASLLSLLEGLISATVFADVTLGGGSTGWQTVSFTGTDIQNNAMKSVSTNNLAQATVASLLTNTSITANVLGLPLGLSFGSSGLQQALLALLSPVAAALDVVVNELTGLLGVQLGQADVWADGLRCQGAALVA
ncbi:MAG: TadG family pilus assembly protein [Caulobacteraceae bacterium]